MSSGIGQLLAEMAAAGPQSGGGGSGTGTGLSAAAQEELQLHRIHAGRPGHAAFLEALGIR